MDASQPHAVLAGVRFVQLSIVLTCLPQLVVVLRQVEQDPLPGLGIPRWGLCLTRQRRERPCLFQGLHVCVHQLAKGLTLLRIAAEPSSSKMVDSRYPRIALRLSPKRLTSQHAALTQVAKGL